MDAANGKTLLVVEDEFLLAMNEKAQLEKYGYNVITAISGEKAIELMNGGGSIDLILMDINLGKGMDGTQTAETILKDHGIPIVFLSSHMEPEIVEKTEKITSYGYVVKNSSITVLDASIKMAFKLFEAHKKLEATLDALPDLLFEVGLDGTYYNVHSNHPQLLYKIPSEIIGKRIPDVLPSDVSDTLMSAIREAHEEGSSFGKQYNLHVPSGHRWFEISVSRIARRSADPRFIFLAHDITDVKQSEKVLMESEEKYRNLFNKAEVGMFRSRLDGSEFLESNDKYLTILGKTREETIGKPTSILWADLARRDEMVKELRAEGHVDDLECRLVRGDGKVITCITSLKLFPDSGILEGSIIDITERKELEDALRQKERRLQAVFDAMTEGFSIQEVITDESGDPIDLRFVDANPAFEVQTGLRNAETFGHTLRELFPTSEQYWIERYGKVGLTGEAISFEAQFSPLGKYYHVSAFQTEPRQFGVIFMDVAEARRAQEETRKSLEALRESESRFKSLVHDMPVGVLIQGPNAEILMSNPMALELLGLSEDQLLGKTSFDPDWSVIHQDGSLFPGETHPVPQAIASLSPVREVVMGVGAVRG